MRNLGVTIQDTAGDPVTVGDVTVTPQARALIVRLPVGGFVWNRPTSVVIERAGRAERVSIVDVTRVAQLALLGLAVLASFGFVIQTTRRKETVT